MPEPNAAAEPAQAQPLKTWTDPRMMVAVFGLVTALGGLVQGWSVKKAAEEPGKKADYGYDALRAKTEQQAEQILRLAEDVKTLRAAQVNQSAWTEGALMALAQRSSTRAKPAVPIEAPPVPQVKSNPPVSTQLPRSVDTLIAE